eukprot:997217-Heterocapsa_arctica.AAC.1
MGPGLPTTENCEPPQCGWALLDALVKRPTEQKVLYQHQVGENPGLGTKGPQGRVRRVGRLHVATSQASLDAAMLYKGVSS